MNLYHKTHWVTVGFTLIEALVALSVMSLLLVIALPAFKDMMMNNRLLADTDTLVNSLNYARNTALNQGVRVRVCPLGTLNATACGTSWGSGWIIITQPTTGAATLLQTQQLSTSDPTLTSSVSTITFDTHGLATAQANFKLCDTRGSAYARSVEVLATGFIQSGNTPGVAVWDSSALSCP